MLATHGPWLDRRRPENTWPSVAVAVAATCGLFVAAFLAMQTVGRWTGPRSEPLAPPVVVRLTPPRLVDRAPPERQLAPVAPSPIAPAPVRRDRSAPPIGAPPFSPIIATPSQISPATADTASGGRASPGIPRGIVAPARSGVDVPYTTPGGVGATASGVTIGSRRPNTQAFRDSVLTDKLNSLPYVAARHPPTGKELEALRQSQEVARMTYRRVGTAGNANVHIPQGEGRGGEGAVGGSPLMMSNGRRSGNSAKGIAESGGGSVGFSFLSPGPSAAERKRNEALVRDYQMGLRRLQDRLALKRDSLVLDSLRLDSLRRDSLARRRP